MAAQWFDTAPTQTMTGMLLEGAQGAKARTDAQAAQYDWEQKQKLQKIFSGNIDALGNLNENEFYKHVSSEGLDPQHAAMAMEWRKQQIGAMGSEGEHSLNSAMYGANPQASGRNTAGFGAPNQTPQVVPGTVAPESQAGQTQDPFGGNYEPQNEKPKQSGGIVGNSLIAAAPPEPKTAAPALQSWFDKAKADAVARKEQAQPAPQASYSTMADLAKFLGMPQAPTQQQAPVSEYQVAPPEIPVISQGMPSKGEEGKLPLPPVPTTEYTQPQEDQRSFSQRYADSITNPMGMGLMPGQDGSAGGKKYFTLDQNASPETKQAFATTLQRNGMLNVAPGMQPTVADVNQALMKQQDADYAAIGLPPGPQFGKDGKLDRTATMNAQREYLNKFPLVYQKWVSTGGKEYADQLTQRISADANDRATVQLNNDVKAKNAENTGMNTLVTNLSKEAAGIGKTIGDLDPTTFTSKDKVEEFNKRIAAFNKLQGSPKTPLELLNAGKNFSVAEGLGEAEGTRNLFMALAAPDLRTRMQIYFANGGNANPSELLKVFGSELLQGSDIVNLDRLKPHMAINGEVDAHRGKGAMPYLSGFTQGAPVTPSAPALVSQAIAPPQPVGNPTPASAKKPASKPAQPKPIKRRSF